MSDTLTGLMPIIYEARDIVAREQTGLSRAVSIDASSETAAVGVPIRSPVSLATSLTAIVPGVTVPDGGSQTIQFRDLIMTNSFAAPIRWTGEEQKSVGPMLLNTIIRDQFVQAFRAIANNVEASLVATAVAGASRAVGTPGTTPFATAANFQDFANVHSVLDNNGCPTEDRALVLGSQAWNNIRGVQSSLFKANEAGTDALLRDGVVNKVLNFSLGNSFQVDNSKHVHGLSTTAAAYLVNNGAGGAANAVGDTVLTANSSVANAAAGDIVQFTGDTNKYIASGGASSVLTLNAPGLLAAVANATTFTGGASYIPNVGLHKSAISLACRAPAMPMGGDGASDVTYVSDPVNGLTYQVCFYRLYKMIKIEIGLVWGSLAVKPEYITILTG